MPRVTMVIRMRARAGRAAELAEQCRAITDHAGREPRAVGSTRGMAGDDLLAGR